MKPGSDEAAAAEFLKTIPCVPQDAFDNQFIEARVDKDGLFNYIGKGESVTKARLLRTVSAAADVYSESVGGSWLVIYIAAHGGLDGAGRPYILPSDATENPQSWILYDDVMKPILTVAASEPKYDHPKQVLVIFDSCQRLQESTSTPSEHWPSIDTLPSNVTIVQSTSPGQYAWHVPAIKRETGKVEVTHESRRGFPYRPPRAPRGEFDRTFSSYMSAFPYASRVALQALAQKKAALGQYDNHAIALNEWLDQTQVEMRKLLGDTLTTESQSLSVSNVHGNSFLFWPVPNDGH
jgi:hypothetical protein